MATKRLKRDIIKGGGNSFEFLVLSFELVEADLVGGGYLAMSGERVDGGRKRDGELGNEAVLKNLLKWAEFSCFV